MYTIWKGKIQNGWTFTWGSKRVGFIRLSYRSLLLLKRPFCYFPCIYFAAFFCSLIFFCLFWKAKANSMFLFYTQYTYSRIKLIFHPIVVHSTLVLNNIIHALFSFSTQFCLGLPIKSIKMERCGEISFFFVNGWFKIIE